MNKLCRLGGLIRSESRFPLQRLAPFSSLSAASPRLSNFSNEEDEFEDGGSAVYRYALKNQRPTTIAWIHRLANSVSFIGYVDQHPEIYNCKGSAIGAHTYLNARNRNDSYRGLRIRVEMWNDMAKKCIQHLKPDDFIYVSGCLVSYTKPNENGNDYLNHKIIVNELYYIAQPMQSPTSDNPEESEPEVCQKIKEPQSRPCQRYKESQSGGGETGIEMYKNRLYLWQVFFSSPYEWWDNRKNKKNSRSPDFKHKDTGEVLWLQPNDPSWVKRQLQLLDSNRAGQWQEGGVGSCFRPRVSLWVYDE